jgi:hypothetical protein
METAFAARLCARAPVQGCNVDRREAQFAFCSSSQRRSGARIAHAKSTRATQPIRAAQPTSEGPQPSGNAALDLTQRLLASAPDALTNGRTLAVVVVLAATALLATPEAAHAADHLTTGGPIADLAENEDFWANVLRYISFYFSVLLGTAYVAIKPLLELLKKPTTAVLVVAGVAALYFFVSSTVGAMLGINEYEYAPSSIVTPIIQ